MSYRRSPVKSVEYASITLNGVASGSFTLVTTVEKNYTVIDKLGVASSSGAATADINAMRVELTNNTTVTAFVDTIETANHIVWFRVTQYFPWTMLQPVQHKSNVYTFTAVGAKGEVFDGGFTSGDLSGVASSVMGGVRKSSSTAVTQFGGAAGHLSAYCVADWK